MRVHIFIASALALACTSALGAGRAPDSYGATPGDNVVVPLNTKIWVMDEISYDENPLPNLTQCDDGNGDLVDCFGHLHTLTAVGITPPTRFFQQRLYQGEELALEANATVGFWVTDQNYVADEIRWTVSDSVDETPPPTPVLTNAFTEFDFDDGSSSPEEIPEVYSWRVTLWTVDSDDFGVAFVELQNEDGSVARWDFPRGNSTHFSFADFGGSGPYRAVAVDFAGNRSAPSELIEVPPLEQDPYEASCLNGYIYNTWCYELFPSLLDEVDAGPPPAVDSGSQDADAGAVEDDAGAQSPSTDSGTNITPDGGPTDDVPFDDGGPGGGDATCACAQKSRSGLPLFALSLLLLPLVLRRVRTWPTATAP